jgi:BON domain
MRRVRYNRQSDALLISRSRSNGLPLIVLGSVLATFACSAGSKVRAADPPVWVPSAPPPGNLTVHDLELTLRARRALLQDNLLMGQGLGVSVHNRVATLWGTVSTPELSRRAEERLHDVLGLTTIRNELRVRSIGKPVRQTVLPPLQQDPPPGKQSPADAWHAVETLSRRPGNPALSASSAYEWRPARTQAGAPAKASPPVLDAELESRLIIIPFANQPAKVSLARQIESLRLADERFFSLQADIVNGVVSLRGTVRRWDDAVELATSISHLSGVTRVMVDNVHTEPVP